MNGGEIDTQQPMDELKNLARGILTEIHQARQDRAPKATDKVLDWVSKFLLAVTSAASLSALSFVYQLGNRVLKIEETRMPAAEVQRNLFELQTKALDGPPWLRTSLGELNGKLDAFRADMTRLSERIARIEAGREK